MSDFAYRFLLWDNGQPFQSSRCFIVADPDIKDRRQWTLQLDRPEHAPWFYEIDDIKDWMLQGTPVRKIFYDRSNPRTPYREFERDEVFREYLRKILDKLPSEYQLRRKFALMPSIADHDARTRYKDAIEAAIPDVTILPEPEMVAEYFRLLKRNLELEAGENNVLLVVDAGAATANMTLIVSRRDSTILNLDRTGAQRDLRLRALRGDSDEHAGRWVDKQLAERLGLAKSDAILRQIEEAKVQASLGKSQTSSFSLFGHAELAIDRDLLISVTAELWAGLRPLFEQLCERLYENQTSTDDARRKSKERLQERRVDGPANAHRLIDTILLAGGTSLLPGFEDAMLATLFPDGHKPNVLRVGSSFAVAAAAGGLAHILHNYAPSRLREAIGPSREVFTASLEATLPHSLLLGIKEAAERENYVTILDPNEPFVDDGGTRPITGLPALLPGSEPKSRLVPGLTAGVEARRGRRFLPMRVRASPGRMELHWDPVAERASISSDQVEEIAHLWIDAKKMRKREEAVSDPFDGPLPPNALAVDMADDIILDIGMSKIVAVTADRGWVSVAELEHIIDGGGPDAGRYQAGGIVEDPLSRDGQETDASYNDTQPPQLLGSDNLSTAMDEADETSAAIAEVVVSETRRVDAASTIEAEPVIGEPATAETGASLPAGQQGRGSHSTWDVRVADSDFAHALMGLRDVLRSEAPHLNFDDIVVALLALSVRPIVLLAGPPGCGKSTLVRLIARLLGKEPGASFHDVAVQAHWADDEALFGNRGLLDALRTELGTAHLILFDEFNLTRPEYYLSRLFHSLDGATGMLGPNQPIGSCRVFGTLNIDESSRPPSPKVIDRCFLLELTQSPHDGDSPAQLSIPSVLKPLPGLPAVSITGPSAEEQIDGVLSALHQAVHEHDLRHDLLPSRRVLSDIRALLSLHHRLDLQGNELLDRKDLVDRLIASRILVKMSGAFDQIEPALTAVEAFVEDSEDLPRTRRRLKLARQQARLGFVSPWQ